MAMEQLTEGYQKARRMLALFSALLLVREYLGIDLERDSAGESASVGLPVVDADLKVGHPEALPLVLVALVGYFTYRVLNEWAHSNAERRQTRAARIDLGVTLALAAGGIGLFLFQTVSGVAFADIVDASRVPILSGIGGLGLGVSVVLGYKLFRLRALTGRSPFHALLLLLWWSAVLLLSVWLFAFYSRFYFVVGAVFGGSLLLFISGRTPRDDHRTVHDEWHGR